MAKMHSLTKQLNNIDQLETCRNAVAHLLPNGAMPQGTLVVSLQPRERDVRLVNAVVVQHAAAKIVPARIE
jgi:hypothetical protein